MNRVAQPQAQQAPHLPRAPNHPRQEIVINLISDDEESRSEASIDFGEEDYYGDAPESSVRPRESDLGHDQQPAGTAARLEFADLIDDDPPQIRAAAQAPARPVSPLLAQDQAWGDYFLDEDDFDAEDFARAIELEQDWRFMAEPPAPALPAMEPRLHAASAAATPVQQAPQPADIAEPKDECVQMVAAVFPGICLDHVSDLYDKIAKASERLIAHVLDQMDIGIIYPKAKDKAKDLKRKRDIDEDEEAARKYGAPDRVISAQVGGIRPYIRTVLSHEFPETPMAFIDATLSQSGHRLFSAYQLLDEAGRAYNPLTSGYTKIKNPRKSHMDFREENIEAILNAPAGDAERNETLRELRAARKFKAKAEAKRKAERVAALEEEENERRAQAEGTMKECLCCFGDYPLNRMIHCDADEMHWFCRGCALRNAETEVGQSKYELSCMSMEGCDARFSMSQRAQFLDEKTKIALERNEQEANLRLAGIENLASCPFCPFAAEYPPVEVDREFRCQAPDCEKVSCRLCNLESHIPKSCEENAKETGLSVRRRIEEAMSAALIRKCNKCGTSFIKEEGCNKMRCTLKGCGNVQCYVCSKSCDYDHFNDASRGGKPGNCPLFESVETRHDDEVNKAEKEALEQVRAEHPEYTEDDLKVKVSEEVKKDDERRRARDPRLNPVVGGPVLYRGMPIQAMNAMRMPQFMPRRPPRRVGVDPALPELPDLEAEIPDFFFEPYLGPGQRPGDANPPDALNDLNGIGIFNPLPLEEHVLPPRPHHRFVANPWGPGAPGDPAVLHAAPPNPGMQPQILRFQDLMRYPRPPPPPPAGPPVNHLRNIRAVYRPENPAAEADRQNAQVAAGHEAVVVPEITQTIAIQRAVAQQQIAQAAAREAVILQRVRAGIRRPNFAIPGVPQPPARNDQPADGLAAAALNEAVLLRRRVEQRRGLDPERNVQAHLVRIKEAAHNYEDNNDEQRRLRNREQMERIQVWQNKAGAIARNDENMRQLQGRLDRLRQRADNIIQSDANGEAMAPNELPRRPGSLRLRRRQPDPPGPALPQRAEALRQQQILDHAERDLERSQQMARLRRDQEIDAAITARNLARIRKNNAPATGRARQPQEPVVLSCSPEQPKRKANISDPANEADDEKEDEEEDDEDWL